MVELKAKDAELQSTKKDLKNLENRYQEEVQKQRVINSQTAATVSKCLLFFFSYVGCITPNKFPILQCMAHLLMFIFFLYMFI